LGKFREYGILCELNFAADIDAATVDKAFDDFIDFVEAQGWCLGGGGSNRHMNQFITYNEWEGARKTAYENLTKEDAASLRAWLEQQSWCAAITKLEVRDAWYGWHWTEKEPDKSKIERALKWAEENEPQPTDLDALMKKAKSD
jgi:uncharacterized protein YggL (DUF469 family)